MTLAEKIQSFLEERKDWPTFKEICNRFPEHTPNSLSFRLGCMGRKKQLIRVPKLGGRGNSFVYGPGPISAKSDNEHRVCIRFVAGRSQSAGR